MWNMLRRKVVRSIRASSAGLLCGGLRCGGARGVPRQSRIFGGRRSLQVLSADDVRKMGRIHKSEAGTWESRRYFLRADNPTFSFHHTILYAGQVTKIWYANHVEAVFVFKGRGWIEKVGEDQVVGQGERYELEPGSAYLLDNPATDRHFLGAYEDEDMEVCCAFNPPLDGREDHNEEGIYPVIGVDGIPDYGPLSKAGDGESPTAPGGAKFTELWERLQSSGQTYAEHVMQDCPQREDLENCPYLAGNEVALRTACRESNARSYARRYPVSFVRGQGSLLYDSDGVEYIDALANAGTLALGHNDARVVDAMQAVLHSGIPWQMLDMSSPVKDGFVNEVFGLLPSEMRDSARVQFTGPAGTDVVEAALKLCEKATGRTTPMGFQGAYHGHSAGALSLMGNLDAKSGVTLRNVPHMPFPYSYRCPFGLGGEAGSSAASQYLQHVLDDVESGILKPSCIILECVQGEGGVIPAPAQFLRDVRRITAERDIPMVVDEIQTGIGRTGRMFAFEHAEIVPDVLCLSKAVGGGQPMGIVVYKKDLDKWGPGSHAGTFRGNSCAMATGSATLQAVREDKLHERAGILGAQIQHRLSDLQQRYPQIGDVRGAGLMIGAELVDPDRAIANCRMPHSLPADGELAARVQFECFRERLILERGGRHGAVMRFLPALNMPDEVVESVLTRFETALVRAIDAGIN